mmetsp:Transcript_57303/g.178095  ORF Transcript_57303/g.178095 Transcript_57303/m.178095 type:complete len:342 (-) Transcript_57303:141-1166(-)
MDPIGAQRALCASMFLLGGQAGAHVVHAQEQGVVDDAVVAQEGAVALHLCQELRPRLLAHPDALVRLREVHVLHRHRAVALVRGRHAPDPGALEVVPAVDLEGSVEHVRHHDEVELLQRVVGAVGAPAPLADAQAVQAQEAHDEGAGVLHDVVVVALQHVPQQLVLLRRHRLHHVAAVRGVVEEGAALALRGELGERGEVPQQHVAQQLLWAHGAQVVVLADAEAGADPLEDHGRVVDEARDGHALRGRGVEHAREPRHDAELLLHFEVHRLQLTWDLLPATANGHADADHHAEHHVPILMAEVHRKALLGPEQPVPPPLAAVGGRVGPRPPMVNSLLRAA